MPGKKKSSKSAKSASKKKSQAEKKAVKKATLAYQAQESARKARLLNEAQYAEDGVTPRDVLTDFLPFTTFQKNGTDSLRIAFTSGPALAEDPKLLAFEMSLLESNMRSLYEEAGWGWKENEKKRELTHPDSRHLIVYRGDGDSASPVGFVNFRFEAEGVYEVLYTYEMQLADEPSLRRRGVGKHIMQLLELVARKAGMQWMMLTVFKTNIPALAFYINKLRYEIDETSPSVAAVEAGEPDESTYEILSKPLDAAAKKLSTDWAAARAGGSSADIIGAGSLELAQQKAAEKVKSLLAGQGQRSTPAAVNSVSP